MFSAEARWPLGNVEKWGKISSLQNKNMDKSPSIKQKDNPLNGRRYSPMINPIRS